LETVGKTDYDYFPKDRADAYVAGDRRVMESGEPILNAIAPAPEEEGSERLIIYSKIPVRDRHGKIIGVAGIHREIERLRTSPKSYGRLSRAVQYAHAHYAEPLTTRKLSVMVGISPTQFERRFRQLFGASVRQYLLRLRVNAACRLLTQGEEPITGIALEVGFYDHSHFTRTFTRLMGVTPLTYRNRHQP
jgi:AraC-like DNA-binding protein